jgi:hypothetical protein
MTRTGGPFHHLINIAPPEILIVSDTPIKSPEFVGLLAGA